MINITELSRNVVNNNISHIAVMTLNCKSGDDQKSSLISR
jgi:hypothetical protein